MLLVNGSKQYLVGNLVAKSVDANFYICNDEKGQYFLQIATGIEKNPKIGFEAYVLNDLKLVSDIFEKKYQAQLPGEHLNFDWLFPDVVDSFLSQEQGGRGINILAIKSGDVLEQMVPLSNILEKDHKIVDLATSVWIIGRLLKLLVLTHSLNISLDLDSDNVIIEPKEHHVVVLDWANVKIHQDEIPEDVRKADIASVASIALKIIGERYEQDSGCPSRYPKNVYVDFLKSLIKDKRSDIRQVYNDFESAQGNLLESNIFYPFTTSPI